MKPSRPALRYFGGKWRLAPWVISHFPKHKVYVEPFGGAASVLIRKPPSYAEVYNDLWGEVVDLFRVLRDPEQAAELIRLLELTPFAREEFEEAQRLPKSPNAVENARRLIIRSYMGHGANSATMSSGFRADSNRSNSTPAHDWANLPPGITAVAERFRGVVIENRPAVDIMRRFDRPDTLTYLDPPYVTETRTKKKAYQFEMCDAEHAELLDVALSLEGFVVISGYHHPLYDEKLAGWRRVETEALADGAADRTEVLWINPRAEAGHRINLPLFEETLADG